MARTVCICRAVVEAEREDKLFEAMRAHTDANHAELNISDDQIRQLLAQNADMEPWDGRRRPLPGPVEVVPLTPDRQEDFLTYFDREAFTDNPGWASCYCFFYRFEGSQKEWRQRPKAVNRQAQADLIGGGEASGYLAYAGGRVVGWCHAAPRGDLPLLDAGPTQDGGERIAAIVCFNVRPAHRGQGVAATLLGEACADLSAKGFTVAEAYPVENPRDDGQAYHGPLSMYLAAGFAETGRKGPYRILRRRL
jgi:GNAT superfamily N-acetyltransferase